MGIIKSSIVLFGMFMVILGILFVFFVVDTFSLKQTGSKADAIVVLAGGKGRIEEGIRMYRKRQGTWLLLVGVDPAVRKYDLYHEEKHERGSNEVVLEKSSRNTLENALYSRELILEKKIDSVLLLTSRYHMKRAILIFRNILPKNVTIYPYPVDSKNLKEEWWRHFGSLRLLFSEFYKYCLYKLFFLSGSGELRTVKNT